jgi:hypothetical protein
MSREDLNVSARSNYPIGRKARGEELEVLGRQFKGWDEGLRKTSGIYFIMRFDDYSQIRELVGTRMSI